MKKDSILALLFEAICLIFLFSACDKEVQLPTQNTPQLSVVSYISPQQSTINVFLSASRPYYGVSPKSDPSIGQINNATVIISDGSMTSTIPWNSNTKQYAISSTLFPITTGKTYYLQITAPGWPTISAQTNIPQPIPVVNTDFVFLEVQKNIEATSYSPIDLFTYQFSTSRAPAQGMYYRFYPTLQINSLSTTTSNTSDLAYQNPANGDPYLQEYTPSTTGATQRTLSLVKKYNSSDYSTLNSSTTLSHTGHFISCSKAYYLFYKTAPQNLGINPSNPFANADNLYSNINGGYGIFAGYNDVTVTKVSNY